MIALTIDHVKELLERFAAYESLANCTGGKSGELVNIRTYGKIVDCYQWQSRDSIEALLNEFESEKAIVTGANEKTIALLQIGGLSTVNELNRARSCIKSKYPALMEMYHPFFDEDVDEYRLTVIVYQDGEKRKRHSGIQSGYNQMIRKEKRVKKELINEFGRIEELKPAITIEPREVGDMIQRHHLLWRGAASSYSSAGEVVDKLKQEVLRQKDDYDVSGMILFMDVDRDFTTMSEIESVRDGLYAIIGRKDARFGMILTTERSHIKFLACRLFLIGNPKCILGELFLDFGKFEILLYTSDNEKRGHMIIASYEDDELTISRYDWGDYERNRRGETDDHLYFDKENTAKLCDELKVKRPESLLRALKKRFASGSLAACADNRIKNYCDNADIQYDSMYYD